MDIQDILVQVAKAGDSKWTSDYTRLTAQRYKTGNATTDHHAFGKEANEALKQIKGNMGLSDDEILTLANRLKILDRDNLMGRLSIEGRAQNESATTAASAAPYPVPVGAKPSGAKKDTHPLLRRKWMDIKTLGKDLKKKKKVKEDVQNKFRKKKHIAIEDIFVFGQDILS